MTFGFTNQWTGAGPLAKTSSFLFQEFDSDSDCELLKQDTSRHRKTAILSGGTIML